MRLRDYLISAGLALVALVLFFVGMADFAYPGESAALITLYRGLDPIAENPYPIMGFFAKLLGGGNLLAPIVGAIIIYLVSMLTINVVRRQMMGEFGKYYSSFGSRLAGIVAAVVLMLTPAFRSAATHLEPRLFDALVVVIIFAIPIRFFQIDPAKKWRSLIKLVSYLGIALSLYFFFGTTFQSPLKNLRWMFVLFFTVIPFVVAVAAGKLAFERKPNLIMYIFHAGLAVTAILSVATPFSPSTLLEPLGVLPVIPSIFAAYIAAYVITYYYVLVRQQYLVIGYTCGGTLLAVLLFAVFFNFFMFDTCRGKFADDIAREIIHDLGDREWFVSDGSLDNHIKLIAAAEGKKLNVISLKDDLNSNYLKELAKVISEANLGGERNSDLVLSANLGVLPFLQDWLAIEKNPEALVAIFGAPDLWYSVGKTPIPERLFFGADKNREVGSIDSLMTILDVPDGWGSLSIYKVKNPVERMRLELRRHLGFLANNRAVYLQDVGDEDEAFRLYELVRNHVDSDNLCALFNLFEMARQKHPKALLKKNEYDRELKQIVDDPSRRYRLWSLANYYGYIRSPEIFIRLGFTWARSGRPGEALSQIRRAIDFIPTDRRASLLNMMAVLYANEDDRAKSRRIYESVLSKNANDHDALMGMMRLSLLEGKSEEATAFLERAAAAGEIAGNVEIEKAMLYLMKGELNDARTILQKIADKDQNDMRAWSLLAATLMQIADASKDPAEKKAIELELETNVLPTMEKATTNPYDYYVQSTRAFLLLRKGAETRKAARDAFEQAMRARPDITSTQDIVLGLDISLDDPVAAERHARDILRRNRTAPLANYVMGSIALRANNYDDAERYLKRAADHERGVALAMNDLAEVYRRKKQYAPAEKYARMTIEKEPKLYVAYETLGSILMDSDGNLDEAEENVRKAVELSKVNGRAEDVRMLVSLARVLLKKDDKAGARATLRRVTSRVDELSDFEKGEYEELLNNAR